MAFQLDPTCLQNLLALAGWPSHLLPSHSQAASMMPRTTNRSGAAACCYETKAGTGLERNLRSHAVTKRSQSRRQTGVCPALEEAVKLRCENLRHRARIKMLTATPVEGTTARHHRGLPRFSHRARRRMGLADTRSRPGRVRPRAHRRRELCSSGKKATPRSVPGRSSLFLTPTLSLTCGPSDFLTLPVGVSEAGASGYSCARFCRDAGPVRWPLALSACALSLSPLAFLSS